MNIREEIKNSVLISLKILKYEGDFSVKVLRSSKSFLGDYYVSIAMEIGKRDGIDPMEVAEKIKGKIRGRYFERIEIVSPGFIYFFVSQEYILKEIEEALKKGKRFGCFPKKKEKIQVEFISANPTGPLTVSHGREGIWGDVLGNVLLKYGFNVKKTYHINNQGKQMLILGHSVLKDDGAEYGGDYIDRLHKKIKGRDFCVIGKRAAKIIMQEMIKKTVKKLKIKFDEWPLESSLQKEKAVDKVVDLLKEEGLIYEQEGSEWFMSTALGDERDRMIIKSNGGRTCLLEDITYNKYKFEKKKFDRVINIWGTDHLGSAPGLIAGADAIMRANKLQIIILQFVVVVEEGKTVRMSKAGGEFIVMDDLLKEIPVDVIRFLFLTEPADVRLNFDSDLARSWSEDNPVFKIKKSYALISNIFKGPSKILMIRRIKNIKLLNNKKEIELMKQILRFPEIIEDTANDYGIQRIPQYALDLTNSFNNFYTECYLANKDKEVREAHLNLIAMTKIVLKNVLDLMGISISEKIKI
jgi:arginyl-tRNA synthetase